MSPALFTQHMQRRVSNMCMSGQTTKKVASWWLPLASEQNM